MASEETGEYLKKQGIECSIVPMEEFIENLSGENISFIINSPTKGNNVNTEGFKLRRKASEHRISVFTCLDTAREFINAIEYKSSNNIPDFKAMNEYFG